MKSGPFSHYSNDKDGRPSYTGPRYYSEQTLGLALKREGPENLTRDELDNYISKSKQNIVIDKIESDIENAPNDLNGPWNYKAG